LYSKKYELEEYLNIFLWESSLYGYDFSYVKSHPIKLVKKENLYFQDRRVSGLAYGIDNDELIHIEIWWPHFNNEISSHASFKIMFHELGHDILNLNHSDDYVMMNSNINYNKMSLEDFINLIPSLFIIK